jgi:hypothetical protein
MHGSILETTGKQMKMIVHKKGFEMMCTSSKMLRRFRYLLGFHINKRDGGFMCVVLSIGKP